MMSGEMKINRPYEKKVIRPLVTNLFMSAESNSGSAGACRFYNCQVTKEDEDSTRMFGSPIGLTFPEARLGPAALVNMIQWFSPNLYAVQMQNFRIGLFKYRIKVR